MDSNLAAGRVSGVRVFTVFVLSGSLFLLIYNVGRRRMNRRSSRPFRETVPAIGNPNSPRGYFSHHLNKPLARHRKPSLTVALENSSSTPCFGGSTGPGNSASHLASSSDAAKYVVETSGVPGDGEGQREDTQPVRSQNATYSATCFDREPSSSTVGHEGYMLEHMKRSIPYESSRGSISGTPLNFERRRSSSSFLGDMSQLETSRERVMGARKSSASRRVSFQTDDYPREDVGQQRPSLPQTGSTIPQEQFLKPMLHIFIWCVLSYSCHVYSSTGLGAKMARFPAPFLKTTVDFLMQSLISYCMMRWPRNRSFLIPWNTIVFTVVPVAAAAALDSEMQDSSIFLVALGVPISSEPMGLLEQAYRMFSSFKIASFETIRHARYKPKGYVPLWVFLFALAFRLESRSPSIVTSIAFISAGFMLAVMKESKLGFLSFKESTVGPFLSGFRWASMQVLLQVQTNFRCKIYGIGLTGFAGMYLLQLVVCRNATGVKQQGLMTPVVTMRALSPAMALVTAVLSLVGDPWLTLHKTEFFDTPENAFKSFGHLIIGAVLATALALAEFVVVYHTSALTIIILGMLKDFCVVVPRMFRDQDFSRQNLLGVGVFSVGILSLTWLKYQKLLRRTRLETLQDDALSVASASFTGRWVAIWAGYLASNYSPVQQVSVFLDRAKNGGLRLSRKIKALWELAS